MRIDKFLKNSRIIKRRTVAKEACEGGRVSVNGKNAKPGVEVAAGDIVEVRFGSGTMKVKIVELIENPKRNEGENMYEIME
ncbi:MAG: RNA-binding S4 domain-containing protein [Gallicola sp.]|nr:RNA-binding S4 domain-containing protein [Gallicola sp.]